MTKLLLSATALWVTSASMLMGAGTQEDSETRDSGLSPPGVYPIVNEGTVTFSMFNRLGSRIAMQNGRRGEGDYARFEDYYVTELLRERTNVEVEFENVAGDGFLDRLLMMFSSGSPSDVVGVHCCLSKLMQTTYIDQGHMRSLTNLIESHSVHYKERLEEIDGLREFVTATDGKIYMLGAIRAGDILEETYGNNLRACG